MANEGVLSKKSKSMLTKSERRFVSKKIDKLKVDKICPHCSTREFERGIVYDKSKFEKEINWGTFVELQKYDDGTTRYLFRGKEVLHKTAKGEANVVFVVVAGKNEVRSCWLNNVNDHHRTLDTTVYDEDAEIWNWL